MDIKVLTAIYLSVEDAEAGEQACRAIREGLADNMAAFPGGRVLGVEVDRFEEVFRGELSEKGFTEE